jgi:hypothetical protein
MKNQLQAAGVQLVGNREPFEPHVTIAKLNRAQSQEMGPCGIDYSAYGRMVDFEFGTQPVLSVQLCEVYSSKNIHTGFYKCVSTLTNTVGIDNRLHCRIEEVYQLKQFVNLIHSDDNENVRSTLVILRGMPGAGKSHLRGLLQEHCRNNNLSCVVACADEHVLSASGVFDVNNLQAAHTKCRNIVDDAFRAGIRERYLCLPLHLLISGVGLIVLDNTNTRNKEYEPYEAMAQKYGADILILEIDTRWAGYYYFYCKQHYMTKHIRPSSHYSEECTPGTR